MIRPLSTASLLALSLALPSWAQDDPVPGFPKKETVRAFSLNVSGDGRVELKIKDKDGERSYAADSTEEFRKKYPELAREYHLSRMPRLDFQDFAKPFEEWKRHFGGMNPEWEKFFEHPERLFEQRGSTSPGSEPEDRPAASPRRLGVRLAPVADTLADQLSLAAGKGAQILEVEDGSAAEKAGLRKHDVLVRIDGKEADGVEGVRSAVLEALKKKEFDVDLLRQGKKQTIKVDSPGGK